MSGELVSACAAEAAALAEQAAGAQRKRLLVLAHALELAERELDDDATPELDRELAAAIRQGARDGDAAALGERLRDEVRRRLAVVSPGYGS